MAHVKGCGINQDIIFSLLWYIRGWINRTGSCPRACHQTTGYIDGSNGRVVRSFFDGDVARFNINCFTKSQYDIATYRNTSGVISRGWGGECRGCGIRTTNIRWL